MTGNIMGKQYEDSHDLEGVTVDSDTFDLDYWEDDMGFEQADRDALDLIRRYLMEPQTIGVPPATTEDIYAQLKALKEKLDAHTGSGAHSHDG